MVRLATRLGTNDDRGAPLFDELDARLLDLLEAPLETLCTCCHESEQRARALRVVFLSLPADKLGALSGRLGGDDPYDEVTVAFRRLPLPLGARLRAFLDHHVRHLALEEAHGRSLDELERRAALEPADRKGPLRHPW